MPGIAGLVQVETVSNHVGFVCEMVYVDRCLLSETTRLRAILMSMSLGLGTIVNMSDLNNSIAFAGLESVI